MILPVFRVPIVAPGTLVHGMDKVVETFFNNSELSDVEIITEDNKHIPAHKFVLASRSSVFKAMLYGNLKESNTNKVTLKYSSKAVMAMLEHVYTFRVNIDGESVLEVCLKI